MSIPAWVLGDSVAYLGFQGSIVVRNTLKVTAISAKTVTVLDTVVTDGITRSFSYTFTPGQVGDWGFQSWVNPYNPLGSIVGPEGEKYSFQGLEIYDGVNATAIDFSGPDASGQIIYQTDTGLILEEITQYPNHAIIQNFSSTSSVPAPVTARADFHGDDASDLLWNDTQTGLFVDWTIAGGRRTASYNVGTMTPGKGWSLVGTGDFNGDGTTDLLFQNSSSGELIDWDVKNGVEVGSHVIGTISRSSDLSVVGVGDFIGNGTSDILLHDSLTGQTLAWVIQNDVHEKTVSLGADAAPLEVIGTGFFTDDLASDILLENTSTRALVDWEVINGARVAVQSIGTAPAGWTYVGNGDLTGGGASDLLFETASGALEAWNIRNGGYLSTVSLGASLPKGFGVASIGNFSGGGASDVMIYDKSTGAVEVGLVSGEHIGAWSAVGSLSPSSWRLAG